MTAPAPITVLTVSIPGREDLLAENLRSVYAQTVPVARQLILAHVATDDGMPQIQYARAKNRLLRSVNTKWVAILNDDDLWLPHHVETILPHLDGADVVYTFDKGRTRPRVNANGWDKATIGRYLEQRNMVDANCAIRCAALIEAGCFPTDWAGGDPKRGGHFKDSPAAWEDWALWIRMNELGARFRCVPVETWWYRTNSPQQICG